MKFCVYKVHVHVLYCFGSDQQVFYSGAQFEGDLGEILALWAEISPYIGLREKWESP